MAHEVETMAYVGETPWHNTNCVRVEADLTPEEMLKAAGLDWTVEKRDIYFHSDQNGKEPIKLPRKQALVRVSDDTFFDTVGTNWKPLQNLEAFQLFNDFVKQGDMEMHTAGSLKNGQIVWALAKIKNSFEISKGDLLEQYLLFVNPHKRGKAIEVLDTDIRVVCYNTMNFALTDGATTRRIKVNHNQKWDQDYVIEMLGLAKRSSERYREAGMLLASRFYKEAQAQEYFTRVFPNSGATDEDSKNAQRAYEVLHTQPGANLAEGTWWQAFNAVTWLTDHELGRSADTRLTSSWFGTNRTRKQKALNLAIEYAEAA